MDVLVRHSVEEHRNGDQTHPLVLFIEERPLCSGSRRQTLDCSSSLFSLFPPIFRDLKEPWQSLVRRYLGFVFLEKHLQLEDWESLWCCCYFLNLKWSTCVKTQMNQLLCFLALLHLPPLLCCLSLLHQLRSQYSMCNRWWDAVREPVLWQTLRHLKFWFATENTLWRETTK